MKTKILSIFTFAFIFSVGAQSLKGNKYYLKNLETIHEITFNEYYKKEKKIFANWEKNEDLTKVIITEQYDSSKLFNLLEKISMNENITDLFISFGNISFLKLPELPFIKVLKIYNSKNLNSNFFNENKLLFNEIKSFSWVNNAKTIDLNLLDNLQKLNSLELIDTGINVINDDVLAGLYKIKDLQNFAFSYKNMPTINLNNFAFLNSFTPLNFEKIPFQLSVFNLLNTEDLNTHSVNVGNKILVKYFNQKNIFTENELASIINNVGLGKYPIKANYFDEISSRSNTIFKQEELETINELPEISGSDYAKNTAYFKKPIEAIQLEEKLIQFKQDKDTLIQLKNGTQIGIPKNCFINAKGEQVTDNIKIIYKEYSNPLSIFASGIPMSTMVNGEAKTLTSAGMFEIRAYSNDKELQIKEGKTIDINFASIDDGKKYNFYEFDKQKNTWVDKNIDLPKDTLPAKIVKSNTQSILNTYQNNYTNKVNFKDTTRFNVRFNDFSYYYLNNEKQNLGLAKYSSYTLNKRTKKSKTYRLETSTKPFKKKRNLVRFINIQKEPYDSTKSVILNINEMYSIKYFPELIAFSNYKFYNSECQRYKYFKEKYLKDKIYSDVRVVYKEGDDYCTFILKGESEFEEIKFNIYDEFVTKNKKQNYLKRSFMKRMENYERKIYEREIAFNNIIKIEIKKVLSQIKKPKINSTLNDSNVNQMITWLRPVNAARRIQLVKTGLYNCDVQYENVLAKVFSVSLKNLENSDINFNSIYIFDENANTYFKYETKNIVFQPETLMGIIATTASGALYYLNQSDIKTNNFKEANISLTMNKPDSTINTLEKLLQLFKIKA